MPRKSDRPARRFRQMSEFLLRACRLILNLFLTLLLLVQAAILFAGFIDVPEIAIEQLQKQLRTEGFEADFQAVRVDFPGGITISELQILSIETDETLVSAQYGRI